MMTSAPIISQPPGQVKNEPGSQIVLVRLAVPFADGFGAFVNQLFCPGENRIGTMLLASVLRRGIEQRGIGVIGCGADGPLNTSAYLFAVSDFRAALASIKADLLAHAILECSLIGWWDAGEGVARVFYPDKSQGTLCSLSQFSGETPSAAALLNSLRELLARLSPPARPATGAGASAPA
jgi:hypothetical protein